MSGADLSLALAMLAAKSAVIAALGLAAARWLGRSPAERVLLLRAAVALIVAAPIMAVVALAVPLYRQMAQWRGRALAISAAELAGSAASMLAGAAVAFAFGLPEALSIALAPRSATMPVAMAAERSPGCGNMPMSGSALPWIFVAMLVVKFWSPS